MGHECKQANACKNVSAYVKVSIHIAFLYTEVAGRDQLVLVEPNHIVLKRADISNYSCFM